MNPGEWIRERLSRRNAVVALLLILLALLGTGIGNVLLADDVGDGPDAPATATPTPGGGGGTETPAGGGGTPVDGTPVDATPTPTTAGQTGGGDEIIGAYSSGDGLNGDSGDSSNGGSGGDSGDDGGGGNTAPPTPDTDVSVAPGATTADGITVQNLVPGDTENESYEVENVGAAPGELVVELSNIVDKENGTTEPERDADNQPGGELSDALEARLVVSDGRGATYLVGGATAYEPFSTLNDTFDTGTTIDADDSRSVRLDVRLPASTGNEVQTDSVSFDIAFTLRSTE